VDVRRGDRGVAGGNADSVQIGRYVAGGVEVFDRCNPIARAKDERRLVITGNRRLEVDLGAWLTLSPFAKVKKLVA
jgi:hypothetical protein